MSDKHYCTGCGRLTTIFCVECGEWRCFEHLQVHGGWCIPHNGAAARGRHCAKNWVTQNYECKHSAGPHSGVVRPINYSSADCATPSPDFTPGTMYICAAHSQTNGKHRFRWREVTEDPPVGIPLTFTPEQKARIDDGKVHLITASIKDGKATVTVDDEPSEINCVCPDYEKRLPYSKFVTVPGYECGRCPECAEKLAKRGRLIDKTAMHRFAFSYNYCENAPDRGVVEQTIVPLDGDECGGVPRIPRLSTHLVWSAHMKLARERHLEFTADLLFHHKNRHGAILEREMKAPTEPDAFGGVVRVSPSGYGLRCALCGGWLRTVAAKLQ